MISYDHKLALITGSSIRIGKYIAQKLAYDGWKIALHYHTSEREAYELAKELLPLSDVMVFKADLTKAEEATRLMLEVKQQMGEVTLLINNASIYKNDNLANLNSHNFEQNLNIHLSSPLYLAQAMKDIDGNIINIIDSDVTHNMNKFFSYSLSKRALFELTKMMAYSLAPSIRVNAIAPGPILFNEELNKELFDRLVEESLLKIKAELQDLYQTIQFLISTPSITGQCIFLDGGRHLI